MKKLLTIFNLFLFFTLKSQTCTLVYDYMETYTWFGNWNTPANTGFYTSYFVSSNTSAALYGTGTGSSGLESAIYVLPNITGLNATYAHKLSFRLGSYKISNSGAATAGVDGPDYIDVRYSTNNGVTAFTEMRITGNANAYWDYNTAATAVKTANGVMTTYTPIAGGDRTATGDGYSIIELTIPAGATQLAFNLNCRVNAAGEEWWIDNAELIQLAPCVELPIELVSFESYKNMDYNQITWVTATETNNSYYTLERSLNGYDWSFVTNVSGAGTVSTPSLYEYKDYGFTPNTYNYYRLKQTDFNGQYKYFNIIFVDNVEKEKPKVIKITNILGQEITDDYFGLIIEYHSDGSIRKIYKLKTP